MAINKQLRILLHDIKSPITSVLGFSELMKKSLDSNSDPKIKKWAETINEESLRIKKLIEDITEEVKKIDAE